MGGSGRGGPVAVGALVTGVLDVEGWWERVSLCPLPSDWWSHVGTVSNEPGLGF